MPEDVIHSSGSSSGQNTENQHTIMHMNPPFLSLPAIGIMSCLLIFTPKATAQTNQEAAIVDVLRAKSQAYFDTDPKKWQSFWLQDSLSSRTIIDKFDYTNQIGWPVVVAGITKDIRENAYTPVTVTYENVHIRASENMAFVEADERLSDKGNPAYDAVAHTYTVLVYENKAWKITNQIRAVASTYAPTASNREYELNVIGYDLIRDKRISEAIAVLGVNVRLNPDSWNAYDSLGEAYALAGSYA